MKEMADGTIRVQVDIDPACRSDFLALFPDIDMPVALALLRTDFEHEQPSPLKGGALAKLAGIFCQQVEFWAFCRADDADEARDWILGVCGIQSRRELDHDVQAAQRFHDRVRRPYMESRT
jgi:hypothetical protein